jgi:hypothetical protein
MRKIINPREKMPDPEILQGFKDLLKIYSLHASSPMRRSAPG